MKAFLCCVLALLAIVGYADAASPRSAVTTGRVCFPKASWSDGTVSDRYRPCIRILRVEEDGSFSFAAEDHDGTVRYTSGVGALDR